MKIILTKTIAFNGQSLTKSIECELSPEDVGTGENLTDLLYKVLENGKWHLTKKENAPDTQG